MRREHDRAYAVLRERLIGGQYGPGAPLREEPLAREFGLSRTPIRAALKRLVEDGLATADAGQGVHVAEWSERDLEETFHLRMLLEPYAARLAVGRWPPALPRRGPGTAARVGAAPTERRRIGPTVVAVGFLLLTGPLRPASCGPEAACGASVRTGASDAPGRRSRGPRPPRSA